MSTILRAKVTEYRKVAGQARRLTTFGGNTAATTNALTRHQERLGTLAHELDVFGHRDVAGYLTEESVLVGRLNLARHLGQERPELRQRLALLRSRIRAAR